MKTAATAVMATSTSRSWVFPQSNHREIWSDFKAVGVGRGCRENFRRRIPAPVSYESGRRKGNFGLAAVGGCKWEEVKTTDQPPETGIKNDPYKVSEEEKRFIEEFRDAYPYIFSHRGRTFVVVISAEIVASPRLHGLLKVSLFFFLSLSKTWIFLFLSIYGG